VRSGKVSKSRGFLSVDFRQLVVDAVDSPGGASIQKILPDGPDRRNSTTQPDPLSTFSEILDRIVIRGRPITNTRDEDWRLAFTRRLQCVIHDINNRFHLDPFRLAGVEVFDALETAIQIRHIIFGNIDP
jgi:hypothetical protein